MVRLRFIVIGTALLLASSAAFASSVVKIRVDDTIQPISAEYIDRAIEQARQTNADAVLIELHTPGGLVDSTREIIEKILDSPVPVIVYVAPTGANAASAGFFILESADIAAMAPGTNTGAAHPVTLGGEKMDDVMKTEGRERLGRLHALVRRAARPQCATGGERGARVEIVDRSGGTAAAPDRHRRQRSGRPLQTDLGAAPSSALTASRSSSTWSAQRSTRCR